MTPEKTGFYAIRAVCSQGHSYTATAEWNGNCWRDLDGKVIHNEAVLKFAKKRKLYKYNRQ